MKDYGEMIFNMEKESNHGLTAQCMTAIIKMERSTVMESKVGLMARVTTANGTKIRFVERFHFFKYKFIRIRVNIVGLTEDSIPVIGMIIICTVMVLTPGKMEEDTTGSIFMIKSTAMGFITGKMEENMTVNGLKENNMDLEFMISVLRQMGKMQNMVSGKWEED